MEDQELIRKKFEEIYKGRPSTIRATLFFGPIGFIFRLVGFIIILMGIGLLIASELKPYFSNFNDFEHELTESELNDQVITFGSGILSMIVGAFLIGIGMVCKRVVRRNNYIDQLEQLFLDK